MLFGDPHETTQSISKHVLSRFCLAIVGSSLALACGAENDGAASAPVTSTGVTPSPTSSDVGIAPPPPMQSGDPAGPSSPGVEPTFVDEEVKPIGGGFLPSERVDLVFVIDNSSSMADKQAIFKAAIPDMIDQMVNPPCVVTATGEFRPFDAATGTCGTDATRIFSPVKDIHIALISSSLGPLGTLPDETPLGCTDVPEENDRGWALGRIRPELNAESYQEWGFLAWDQEAKANPPGDTDLATLIGKFQHQVDVVGENGCGYEAPLEAAYRFLSDPDPYESLERVQCPGQMAETPACVAPVGTDMDLLAQRAQFLRPDSVVVVMFLTDENDCSLRAAGQGYVAMVNRKLSGGTSACDANPNDPCCLPCGATLPDGCNTDPATNGCMDNAADIPEARPLRCFDQQRRFGVSFLRKTDVYIGGYTNALVADRDGNGKPNALFTDERDRDKIFVVGIIGVPWQDTADPDTIAPGKYDLIESDKVDWARFLPVNGALPVDPFNVESMGMRDTLGAHPVTGETIGGPGTWNSINGHDRQMLAADEVDDDLQFSCIFKLPGEGRDCTNANLASCDCVTDIVDGNAVNYWDGNPLCYDEATGGYGQIQHYAKAYPAPRMLEVLRGVSCPDGGECTQQSVVSSICPRQLEDTTAQDYGYRPVIRALLLNLVVDGAK